MIQVIVRAGQILDCFTPARPSFTLTECAALAGLTKSSAYRVLTSLEEIGLVERSENRWRPGPRAVSLAGVRLGHLDLQRETSPRLRALVQPFRAAVAFAVPDGDQMIYVERHESPDPFAPSARLGSRAPIWAGATGRAVLAALSPDERGLRLRAEEFRRLPSAVRRNVIQEVDQAVQSGYAVDPGSFFEGVAGVAVALCGSRGEPLAAISIIVTPERLTDDERAAMGARLLEIKREIEATMNAPVPGLAAT